MKAGDIYADTKVQRDKELEHLRKTLKGNVKKKAKEFSKRGGKTRRRKHRRRLQSSISSIRSLN